jgi:hypothetical protein
MRATPWVITGLLAVLAGAVYVGHYGWESAGDVPMPAWGWLRMGLGIFFSLLVGCGLMALVFYSNRAGFDEAVQLQFDVEDGHGAPAAKNTTVAERRRPSSHASHNQV